MAAVDIPLEPHCTAAETEAAVEYVIQSFGPWYPDKEQRQLRRMFLDYSKAEVITAIDELVREIARPRPADFGQKLEANHKFLVRMAERTLPKPAPEYATVKEAEADWLHEMIAAVKAGNEERIKELQA